MTDKRIKSYLEDRLKRLESIRNEREWTTSELGDIACCKQTLAFIDSLQEEPVSIWHDASEIPEDNNWVLLTHRDGWYHVGRLYEGQHGNLVISDGVSAFKLCEFKRWTYIDDLLKL